jgi:hypothetical protein
MKKYILLIAVVSLFFCCNTGQKNELNGISNDFEDFYNKFHTDSSYQMEHIAFPLEGIPALQLQGLKGKYNFQQADWKIHRSIPDSNIVSQTFIEISPGIIEEEVLLENSGLTIFRRYSKIGNDWFLIYYMAPNYIKQ